SAAARRVRLTAGSARLKCVPRFSTETEKGGSYEISSFDRYSGSIHWYGDCDRTKRWLLWRPVLPPRQRLLREITERLKSRRPRRRNPARAFVCRRHFVKVLTVNRQGCDLGGRNLQSGHLGEWGGFVG